MLEILFAARADADSAVVRWVYSGGKEWEGLENEVQIICSWITTNTAKYSGKILFQMWLPSAGGRLGEHKVQQTLPKTREMVNCAVPVSIDRFPSTFLAYFLGILPKIMT